MTVTTLHNPAEAASWLRSRVRGALHADSRGVGEIGRASCRERV